MNNAGKQKIIINQLLHGYDEGHRFLAGSIKPKQKSAQRILALSDLSGQSIELCNDSYITGYPIPEMETYAIARTWLAPEMSRPGCVWTHTILVGFSDLAAIDSVAILELFRRPHNNDNLKTYGKPIKTEINITEESHSFLYQEDVEVLIEAIYGSPKDSIFVQIEDGSLTDKIALALWHQQWPRLKRNFRFCTWAPSDRSRSDEKFDLQFVPKKQFLQAHKRKENGKLFVDTKLFPLNSSERWATVVAKDIILGNQDSTLKKFLWRYGAEIEIGRAAFKPLVLVWLALEDRHHINAVAAVTALSSLNQPIISLSGFILQRVVKSLGEATLLSSSVIKYLVKNLSLVDESLKTKYSKLIAKAIWIYAPEYISSLFRINSLPERLIAGDVAELMDPVDVIKKTSDDLSLFTSILQVNQNLFHSSVIWDAPEQYSNRAADVLSSFEEPNTDILIAMFESKNIKIPEIGIRIFGQEAVNEAVNFFDSLRSNNQQKVQAGKWIIEAGKHPNTLLTALNQKSVWCIETLALIATQVDYSLKPISSDGDEWARVIKSAQGELKIGAFKFYSFILKRALCGVSPESGLLICNSFDQVHEQLVLSNDDNESWSTLENELPNVPLWKSWDRAYKTRLGVVGAFIKQDISPEYFFGITQDDNVFLEIVDIASSSPSGSSYLEKVYLWMQSSDVEIANKRKKILKKI